MAPQRGRLALLSPPRRVCGRCFGRVATIPGLVFPVRPGRRVDAGRELALDSDEVELRAGMQPNINGIPSPRRRYNSVPCRLARSPSAVRTA